MKNKGFTLIELLVVIAIIALLVSILMPALSKAKAMAKKTVCAAHLHDTGIAIGIFDNESDSKGPEKNKETWQWGSNSGDHPSEYCGGTPGAYNKMHLDLVEKHRILPDRKTFFCPSVRNLSHDKNYINSDPRAVDINTMQAEAPDCNWCSRQDFSVKHYQFWGSYLFLWQKVDHNSPVNKYRRGVPNQIFSVNPISKGFVMGDYSPGYWLRQAQSHPWVAKANIKKTQEHYNALMIDGHVESPATTKLQWNQWLFDSDYYAGDINQDY